MLALPALNIPPWFTPPSYTQAIAFRSILAILGFIYLFKEKISLKKISDQGGPASGWKEALNPRSAVFIPIISLLAYFFIVFVSTLLSLDVSRSLWGTPERGAGFINFTFFVLFLFLTLAIVKKEHWKKLLDFSLVIGFLVGLVAIFQLFGVLDNIFTHTNTRPSSTLGNSLILSLYLLPMFFVAFSFFILEKRNIKKYFYLFLVIFYSFSIIFIAQGRAAFLGLSIGIFWFLIFNPKKMKKIKTGAIILPIVLLIFIFFLSSHPQIYGKWPNLLKEPTIRITSLTRGFSADPARTSAWKISISAFLERPFFGYGPENFYVAFNKHYDPTLPIMKDLKDFDRAHNYLIQILVDSGIFALIFYLVFLFSLFWGLQKIKHQYPAANGLQAGLLAFSIASLASIDGFAIMLIFFFLAAYSIHLIYSANANQVDVIAHARRSLGEGGRSEVITNRLKFIKIPALCVLFLVLIIFLWQYNFFPLQMNKQIIIAQTLANEYNDWQGASKILDKQSKINTFFLPYTNSVYLNMLINRIIKHPDENAQLSKKVSEISQKNTELQPYDYKNWLRLGESLATIAKEKNDPELINKSNDAFNKALKLSPRNPTILFSSFMATVSLEDLKRAKEESVYCLKTFPQSRECLWISGLINIYLGDIKAGKEFAEKAKENGYSVEDSEIALRQLVAAYLETENYKEMLPLYQKLSEINPGEVQYKTSIMLCHKELGNYVMAKQLAQEIIKTNPELKPQIEQFIKSF